MEQYTPVKKPKASKDSDADYKELAYWLDDTRVKTEPDVKQRLEAWARTEAPMEGFCLQRANLENINMVHYGYNDGYNMRGADLYRANLANAHLFHIDLTDASLMKANLYGANLHCANLTNCNLLGVNLEKAKIDNVTWGDPIMQERKAFEAKEEGDTESMLDYFEQSEEIYRNLRRESEVRGLFELAGHFFQKEMTMRRYQFKMYSAKRIFSKLVDVFTGYGEKPLRIVALSLIVIGTFSTIYFGLGISGADRVIGWNPEQSIVQNFGDFLTCLYFSVVTFTTLGYGDLTPIGYARPMAAIEAFCGSFTIALFVVVFVKKMTR